MGGGAGFGPRFGRGFGLSGDGLRGYAGRDGSGVGVGLREVEVGFGLGLERREIEVGFGLGLRLRLTLELGPVDGLGLPPGVGGRVIGEVAEQSFDGFERRFRLGLRLGVGLGLGFGLIERGIDGAGFA